VNYIESAASIKAFFWPRPDGKKYVVYDNYIHPTILIDIVQEVVGWKYSCYTLVPVNPTFPPLMMYFTFISCLSRYLQKAKRLLEAMGAYKLYRKGEDFDLQMSKQNFTRQVNSDDLDWRNYLAQGGKLQQKYYMITFGNLYSIVCIALWLFGVAFVSLAVEIISARNLKQEILVCFYELCKLQTSYKHACLCY